MRRRGERGVSGKTRRGAGNSAPLPLRRGREQPLGGGRREGIAEGGRDPRAKVWGNFPLVWGRGRASGPRSCCGQRAPSERLPPFPLLAHLGSPSLAPSLPAAAEPCFLRLTDKAGARPTPRGTPGSPCWISGVATLREVCPAFPPKPRPRVS